MKAHLMFKNRDFTAGRQQAFREDALISDLELETLLSAMAPGDPVILEAASVALQDSIQSPDEIHYRQDVLNDCIRNPAEVRELYTIANEAIERHRKGRGLYDISLALQTKARVVGSDLSADHQLLFIVTGANQGGKSTFLRSIGQAQLMMQCGMFVPAEAYESHICSGVYSHFRKGEDAQMKSGKLDEELARMSAISDHLRQGALMLLNESFAATNEREGSEIARQIVSALIHNSIEVFFVTHLFEFADGFRRLHLPDVAFLRAERLEDGTRTFRIIPGEPLSTSFGEDLYRRIFDSEGGPNE